LTTEEPNRSEGNFYTNGLIQGYTRIHQGYTRIFHTDGFIKGYTEGTDGAEGK